MMIADSPIFDTMSEKKGKNDRPCTGRKGHGETVSQRFPHSSLQADGGLEAGERDRDGEDPGAHPSKVVVCNLGEGDAAVF